VEKGRGAFGARQTAMPDSSAIPQTIERKGVAESHRVWCKADGDRSISSFFAAFHNHLNRVFRQISGKLILHRWLLKKRVETRTLSH
jgi:hypothetical protein